MFPSLYWTLSASAHLQLHCWWKFVFFNLRIECYSRITTGAVNSFCFKETCHIAAQMFYISCNCSALAANKKVPNTLSPSLKDYYTVLYFSGISQIPAEHLRGVQNNYTKSLWGTQKETTFCWSYTRPRGHCQTVQSCADRTYSIIT